jgi:hypothetical protein
MISFPIKSRWTGAVVFTAEIDSTENEAASIKLGLAVRVAVKLKANLRGANLSGADLSEADLRWANLRGADLSGAKLSEADLRWADLRWANLSGANLSGADLSRAKLSGANLRGADLRGAKLSEANLRGADLIEAKLSEADLRWANLSGANLSGAKLSGAKLSEAPVIENIHAKVYAAASQPGALNMMHWHCGTSHCRAGWVVTLAGKEGLDLEAKIGTPAAAMAIYMASDPDRWKAERLPDFYCDNATALADMARMAGVTP